MKIEPSMEPEVFDGLPGADLIQKGLLDARAGRETVESLLIEIAQPRLRWIGLSVPYFHEQPLDAEMRLYHLLGREFGPEAYGQYNSLLRRLSSFNRALESSIRRRA